MRVALESLSEEPYASVVCYPKPSKAEASKRLRELQKLGVKTLEFCGEKRVLGIPVLGKGCVSIVVIAYVDDGKLALKIRRVDADRSKMQREAQMLRKANSIHVGPKLLRVSKNFILMQFIDGFLLPKWLEKRRGKREIKRVLREVLEQCWRLDEAGLDHGELSHAPKHVIIDKTNRPYIVDFETASINRKPSNVTSISQFLFFSGSVAKMVNERLGKINREGLVEALRIYKANVNRENFEKLFWLLTI